MLPYFCVGVLAVLGSYLHSLVFVHAKTPLRPSPTFSTTLPGDQPRPAEVRALPYAAVAVLLVVFAGVRYSTGSDYFLYLSLYQVVDTTSLSAAISGSTQGIGFATLMFVLKALTDYDYVIFWASALLTVLPVLLAVKRRSADPIYALFLYFFLGYYAVSFNAVRQSIAVSFLLLADTYRQESTAKYWILSILAMLVHSSAIVLVLMQLVVHWWKPTYLSAISILVLTVPLSFVILNSGALATIASILNPRYEMYLQGEGAGFGTILLLLVKLSLIIFVLSLPKVRDSDRYIAFVCLSAIFLYLGLFTWVIARLEIYFGIFIVILLPNQLAAWKHGRLAKILLGVVFLVYFAIYISNYNALIPFAVVPELRWW